MFVMLNGRTGDKKSSDKGDDDGKDSSESEKNRSGKGDKDRVVMLPVSLVPVLTAQLLSFS